MIHVCLVSYHVHVFVTQCVDVIKGAAHSVTSILRMVGSYSVPLKITELTFDLYMHEVAQSKQITHYLGRQTVKTL